MTRKHRVTDEQLGALARRQHDLFRRVREGSLDYYQDVLQGLQALIETTKLENDVDVLGQLQGGHPYRGSPQKNSSRSTFIVFATYKQPSHEELKSRFDWVNADYRSAKFEPIEQCRNVLCEVGDIEFEYLHLDRSALTEEVLAEMEMQGLRPALYEELLDFAEKYPDEQRKHPIVALGSVARLRGRCGFACLWGDDDGRNLHLDWVDSAWNAHDPFLCVRKSST